MTGNVEWQIGTRGIIDCGMGWGVRERYPLSLALPWSWFKNLLWRAVPLHWYGCHMFLWSPRLIFKSLNGCFCYRKKMGNKMTFVLDIQTTHLIWMTHNFWLAVENWGNDLLHAWLGWCHLFKAIAEQQIRWIVGHGLWSFSHFRLTSPSFWH